LQLLENQAKQSIAFKRFNSSAVEREGHLQREREWESKRVRDEARRMWENVKKLQPS